MIGLPFIRQISMFNCFNFCTKVESFVPNLNIFSFLFVECKHRLEVIDSFFVSYIYHDVFFSFRILLITLLTGCQRYKILLILLKVSQQMFWRSVYMYFVIQKASHLMIWRATFLIFFLEILGGYYKVLKSSINASVYNKIQHQSWGAV